MIYQHFMILNMLIFLAKEVIKIFSHCAIGPGPMRLCSKILPADRWWQKIQSSYITERGWNCWQRHLSVKSFEFSWTRFWKNENIGNYQYLSFATYRQDNWKQTILCNKYLSWAMGCSRRKSGAVEDSQEQSEAVQDSRGWSPLPMSAHNHPQLPTTAPNYTWLLPIVSDCIR